MARTRLLLLMALLPMADARALQAGPPVVVSRDWSGGPAGSPCGSPGFATETARYLSFACRDPLVPDDGNARSDVYLLDRYTGALERASVTSDGAGIPFDSTTSLPSGSGQRVVFQSFGPMHPDAIPALGAPRAQVFLRDRATGETTLVSKDVLGQLPFYSVQFEDADIGRSEVLLQTWSLLLDPMGMPPPLSNVYLRNWQTGAIELISQRADGGRPDGDSFMGRMVPGGRYVLFVSSASDLPGAPAAGVNLYLRDRLAGATERLTRPPGGGEFVQPMDLDIFAPRMTSDHRYIVLSSSSRELAPFDPGIDPLPQQVYVLDRDNGLYQRISESENGEPGNAYSGVADISDDGRYVAFFSLATNLPAGQRAIYVVDRSTGARVCATGSLGSHLGSQPTLSLARDGASIAFSWRSADPGQPELFDRSLLYTVELRGQALPAPVPVFGKPALAVLLLAVGLLAWRSRASGRAVPRGCRRGPVRTGHG